MYNMPLADQQGGSSSGGGLLSSALSSIPVVGGIASSIYNTISGNANNRKERKFAEYMYDKQRNDAIADRSFENEYNSPANQMARLKAAGLNPNLVYGHGAAATTSVDTRSSSFGSPNTHAPTFDSSPISQGVQVMNDTRMKDAQIDNLKAATDTARADQVLKLAQTLSMQTGADLNQSNTDLNRFHLKQNVDLNQSVLEAAQLSLRKMGADIDKTQADTKFTLDENDRKAMMNAPSIAEAIERVARSRAERGLIPLQGAELNAKIANLKADTRIKQADAKLKESGVQPHWNAISQVVSGIFNGTLKTDTPGLMQDLFGRPGHWSDKKNP